MKTIGQHRTTRKRLFLVPQRLVGRCTTLDFFLVLTASRSIVAASPLLRFRDNRWSRYRSNVVSELPTARKPWYSFHPTSLKWPHSLRAMWAQNCLFLINADFVCRRLFHYCLSFSLFLSKGASEAKIVSHWLMFLYILFMNIFFLKFVSKIFFQFFFYIYFQHFFSKFFFLVFSKTFSNMFFESFTLHASPSTETKWTVYVSVLWRIWCAASDRNRTFVSCYV